MYYNVLKNTIDYYRSNGSHVFACFIDFSKAFDSVNYWKLFTKLLNDKVDGKIVSILAFWYSNQECFVRWRNSVSGSFHIGNGTKQGGVLSPYLFSRYIRELIACVVDSGVGCYVANQCLNILAYADDIVLISPSWKSMQLLLNILHSSAISINLSCNISKCVSMMFKPQDCKWIVANSFPLFQIGTNKINFVKQFKYLGHILSDTCSDNEDIFREVRSCFMRTNILKRKFNHCSYSVKILLFKTYCLCFYDIGLWWSYSVSAINKFKSCYNRCIKLFFGFKRRDSLTQVLISLGIPTFDTVLFNARHILNKSCNSCQNPLVNIFPLSNL